MVRKYQDKKCNMCGDYYTPTSPKQKYCLDCKDKAKKISQSKRDKKTYKKKQEIKTLLTKECPSCGKIFDTYYKSKKYCGDNKCEVFRIKLKNKLTHERRDKRYMLEKGKEYYKNNKEKCRLQKALAYRDKNPDAKDYISRGKYKNTYKEVKEYIEDRNYKLISKEYTNCKEKLVLKCPEGHEWETTFHNFRDNGGIRGVRCAVCFQQNNFVSRLEQSVRCFIEESFPDIKVIYNDRSVLKPQELDLYFPDHNLGIEVCGLHWHSELGSGKNRDYHYNKMNNCYKKGIRLITVFEDELIFNKDIVFSRIRQALGRPTRRVFARKCKVYEIDSKTANKFYKENHIQGKSTALVRYGLYFEGELLCVGSLGKLVRKHTSSVSTIELKRFCTLPGVSVIGGVGKIFKQMKLFAKKNNYNLIKSYCDMRYANIFKPVYEVLGFELTNFTKYTPHYFKQQKRYRNYSLRKTPIERLTGKTEWQLRQEQGYDRIWDCGHRTYEYKITK